MLVELQPEFEEVLQPLGQHAIEFFLAASLYHAGKISFASAAHIAGLSFEAFNDRLILPLYSKISYLCEGMGCG